MPGPTVAAPAQNTSVLQQGVRDNFWDAYMRTAEAEEGALSHAFESVPTGGGDSETFAWWETSPAAKIWLDGQPASYGGMKSGSLQVVTRDWQNGLEWKENTRLDDRTKSLTDVAKSAGAELAFIRRRVFFQILTGATNPDLLPAIGNAPDGAAMFSATDGAGAARFGLTGGNIETGGTVATAALVSTDLYKGISRFPRFLSTNGQPMLPESVLAAGFVVYFNVANLQVFNQAFKADLIPTGPNTDTSIAGVSNTIRLGEWTIEFKPVPYITDNDWFIFVKAPHVKPLVETDVMAPAEAYYDRDNSDRGRDLAVEGYHWKMRRGYAVGIPWAAVKINN